jgi:hypothetical protein
MGRRLKRDPAGWYKMNGLQWSDEEEVADEDNE